MLSFDEYKAKNIYNQTWLSDSYWENSYIIYLKRIDRQVVLDKFELYFNEKTGGTKKYQFLNALDLFLFEMGYEITLSYERSFRRWTKEGRSIFVTSDRYGEDTAMIKKIPFQNIESVFIK